MIANLCRWLDGHTPPSPVGLGIIAAIVIVGVWIWVMERPAQEVGLVEEQRHGD